MKLYIAAHSQVEARAVAKLLAQAGHTITSSWLDEPLQPTASYSEASRTAIADQDADDVCAANALVLLASPTRVPGGKFVEAGIAIGRGLSVFVLGARENMLLWHTNVHAFVTVEELITFLDQCPVLTEPKPNHP